jgi:hypothetical protein
LNQYTVLRQYTDPIHGLLQAGEIVTMDADRGTKLAKMGFVALQDEYVKKLVNLRWVNEGLEVYNTQTGAVLLRIPPAGLTSLALDIVGNLTGNTTGLNFGAVNAYAADGNIAITDRVAILDGSLDTCEMTLADGVEGQEIVIKAVDVTNTCSVAPDSLSDGSTITFTDQFSAVRLVFDGTDWHIAGIYLTVGVA